MRVLHLPYTYFPDAAGGTEIYVAQLARELRTLGIESVVAAPGTAAAAYEHEGTSVRRYVVGEVTDRGELQDAVASASATKALATILSEVRPDVLHFHAYTRGVPAETGDAARRMGIPVIVTYHTATVTCARGSLLRNGQAYCDGALFVTRCARCMLQLQGVPAPAAALLARAPTALGHALHAIAPRAGGAVAALRMTDMMRERHRRVRTHVRDAAAVIAPSRWVADLLAGEGVPPERIVVSPQGIDAGSRPPRIARSKEGPIRLALPARYSPEKGIVVVLAALARIPDADVRVDIFGPSQHAEAREYRRMLEERASGDRRIHFHDGVAPDRVVDALADADVVLVPSIAKETGPLVVLEAFAAGTPVIGSDLAGIAERVRDGVDGLLVAPGDPVAWAGAIARVAGDRDLLARLAAGIRPPRRMSDVAAEMASLYGRVSRAPRAPASDLREPSVTR